MKDYFWTVEFEQRGSPRIHSLWCVEDTQDIKVTVLGCSDLLFLTLLKCNKCIKSFTFKKYFLQFDKR